MQEIRRRRAIAIGLRARAPVYVRVLALALLAAGLTYVGLSYWRSRNRPEFRMRSGPTELSTEVVRRVEGFEHTETRNNKLYLKVTAARELTFADGHHELEDVRMELHPETGEKPDTISARRTIVFDDNRRVAFSGNVEIETRDSLRAKTEAIEYNINEEVGRTDVAISFERENVRGRADGATVDAKNKKLELRGGVEITVEPDANSSTGNAALPASPARGVPVTIRSAQAHFDQNTLHLSFSGGATAEQGADVMSGETLAATLSERKRVRHVAARGNSYLRSSTQGRAAEVRAADMDFDFDGEQKLKAARAVRDVRANTIDSDADVALQTAGELFVNFVAQGDRSILREMRAGSRPVITLSAPKSKAGDPKAANKRLTADSVRLFWRTAGRDLERAEAEGNAELFVEPVQAVPEADRKTLFAPRFNCEFYEEGNLAREFVAAGGAKAVVDPVQPSERRGTRTLTSQTMTARFVRETQDVERLDAAGEARFQELERTLTSQKMTAVFNAQALERVDAAGSAKFNERDRNGQAANVSYTAGDQVVRLRGGEPVVWDSRARLKAAEIDSDTFNKISYGRGRATTTYYSQEQTGGATPFGKLKSPVFIVAAEAEFQHETGLGIYTGSARAWQDDNFVKADKIILRREQRRMEGEGNVQSALYQARRKDASGGRTVVPVFATSRRMFYADAERLLHYEGAVDIKQGTERINSEVADVYLRGDAYEVERTIAQHAVVVTQPGKRGTGDRGEYTAADETVVLTGNPARVEDAQQGTSESRRLTVYLRENRVVSDGGQSKQNTGRVHSTHRIRKP
ncbi:MAG TPA: LPS export ABC transporter periplasmic protein LptC [Pyrinomonadaceae bacterium]|nr:LPS export ABC transporter periplasmic protein LptC [Pyrinomonadaceae bacterium]